MFTVRIQRNEPDGKEEYKQAQSLIEVVHIITRDVGKEDRIQIYVNDGFPLTPPFYPYLQS